MYIKCDNINDFCTMITTCSLNNINEVRLFISETDSYSKGLRTASSVKDHIKFTYVFFSPIYKNLFFYCSCCYKRRNMLFTQKPFRIIIFVNIGKHEACF